MSLILLILSNTRYFLDVDTAYTKLYGVFWGVDTAYTKQYAEVSVGRQCLYYAVIFPLVDNAYTKQYAIFPFVVNYYAKR